MLEMHLSMLVLMLLLPTKWDCLVQLMEPWNRHLDSSFCHSSFCLLSNVWVETSVHYTIQQYLTHGNIILCRIKDRFLLKCEMYRTYFSFQIAFRGGLSTKLDDRMFAMCELKTMPLKHLMTFVYPDLYPIHLLSEKGALHVDDQVRHCHLVLLYPWMMGIFLGNM